MASVGFVYRRLARLIPCTFLLGSHFLALRNKFQIASARDVFMSANYWRLFEFVAEPPSVVVDLGSHCGHFVLLMHLLLMEKFGADEARYYLFEPVSFLARQAERTLADAGLADRVVIQNALVGKRSEVGFLEAKLENLLISSVAEASRNATVVPYVDPLKFLDCDLEIDVLKVDIEGSEYDLLLNFPELFRRSRVIAIELHGAIEKRLEFVSNLLSMEFEERSSRISYGNASMHVFVRRGA